MNALAVLPSYYGSYSAGIMRCTPSRRTQIGYAITPYDPTIEAQRMAGREFMREYRDTFPIQRQLISRAGGSSR